MADRNKDAGATDAEALVRAIMDDKNVTASKRLEKILRKKAAKRISEVLDD